MPEKTVDLRKTFSQGRAVGESIRTIHRYLTILKHAGVLENAQGIVFGEFVSYKLVGASNFGDERGGAFSSVADMIDRLLLGGIDVPVAFGFPHGHEDISYPLLMGVTANLDVTKDSYTLSWEP